MSQHDEEAVCVSTVFHDLEDHPEAHQLWTEVLNEVRARKDSMGSYAAMLLWSLKIAGLESSVATLALAYKSTKTFEMNYLLDYNALQEMLAQFERTIANRLLDCSAYKNDFEFAATTGSLVYLHLNLAERFVLPESSLLVRRDWRMIGALCANERLLKFFKFGKTFKVLEMHHLDSVLSAALQRTIMAKDSGLRKGYQAGTSTLGIMRRVILCRQKSFATQLVFAGAVTTLALGQYESLKNVLNVRNYLRIIPEVVDYCHALAIIADYINFTQLAEPNATQGKILTDRILAAEKKFSHLKGSIFAFMGARMLLLYMDPEEPEDLERFTAAMVGCSHLATIMAAVDLLENIDLSEAVLDELYSACEGQIHVADVLHRRLHAIRMKASDLFGGPEKVASDAITSLMSFLDYAENRTDLSAWQNLYMALQYANDVNLIKNLWLERYDWWHEFHSLKTSNRAVKKIRKQVLRFLSQYNPEV